MQIILFDLDDTLLDFKHAEQAAIEQTLLRLGICPKQETLRRYSEINKAQWMLLEKGELSRAELKVRRFCRLFSELGEDCSARQAAAIYEEALAGRHELILGAEILLKQLYGRCRMYGVTNGTAAVQKKRMAISGLSRYFSGLFISEEVGVPKPQKAYFDYCFSHIPEFCREKTLIVGDSLTSDILGGRNAGIYTVWFNPKKEMQKEEIFPDAQIHSLNELLPLLKQLENQEGGKSGNTSV